MEKDIPLSEKIHNETETIQDFFWKGDVTKAVKDVHLLFKERRQKVNEGISDERLLAHLHTFINHFENGFNEIFGEFK